MVPPGSGVYCFAMRMPLALPLSLALAAATVGCARRQLASTVCSDFTPCGGSLAPAWAVASSCPIRKVEPTSCPGLATNTNDVKFGGTVSFSPNKTYSLTRTISGTGRATIPKACFTAANPALAKATCEQIASGVGRTLAGQGAPISKFACKTQGATCDCAMTFNGKPVTQAGKYQTTGNTLLMTYQDGLDSETERWDYCSDATNLRMKPAAAPGGGLDLESSLSGVLVLKKQ